MNTTANKSKRDDAIAQNIRRFIECAQLDEIALDDCTLRINRPLASSKGKMNIELKVDTGFEDGENPDYVAHCSCTIKGTTLDDEKEILDLKVTYVVRYKCRERHNWPEAELDYFASKNVILHVWPYLREFIDQVSRRSNLNRILLPLAPTSLFANQVREKR